METFLFIVAYRKAMTSMVVGSVSASSNLNNSVFRQIFSQSVVGWFDVVVVNIWVNVMDNSICQLLYQMGIPLYRRYGWSMVGMEHIIPYSPAHCTIYTVYDYLMPLDSFFARWPLHHHPNSTHLYICSIIGKASMKFFVLLCLSFAVNIVRYTLCVEHHKLYKIHCIFEWMKEFISNAKRSWSAL